jgi:hypothetical protein
VPCLWPATHKRRVFSPLAGAVLSRCLERRLAPSLGGNRLNQEKTTITTFQFRLNGVIITHLKVRPVMLDGTTDRCELIACHDNLGEFAIDDNADPVLTPFILEVRDVTIPPSERRYLPNKGWRRMTTTECLALLESAGVIARG